MNTSTVEWNNEMIYNLIELYQRRRLLWDTNHKDNRDKNKKAVAWQEIGQLMNMDREAAQRKMKILTTQFHREYSKTTDPTDNYTSKWFAYNKLLFLKAMQPPPAPSSPLPASVTSVCIAPYNNIHIVEENSVDAEIKKEEFDEEESEEDVYQTSVVCRKRAAPSHEFTPAAAVVTREPPAKQSPITVARHTSSPAAAVTSGAEARDEYCVFGEYVAMKLRKLSDAYSRHRAQQEIHNILFSAETGRFTADIGHSSHTHTTI